MHAMHAIVMLTMRTAPDVAPRTPGTHAAVWTGVGYMAVWVGVGEEVYAGVGVRGTESACMQCML